MVKWFYYPHEDDNKDEGSDDIGKINLSKKGKITFTTFGNTL